MNQSVFYLKHLPFFGFLFVGLFVLLILVFRYRTRTSLTAYYLSFVALALGLGEFWMWAEAMRDLRKFNYEGSYTIDHLGPDQELGSA